jgi:drug efflux transport system permease protein
LRTLLYILQKEFIQIFRDKSMLPIIFIIPVVQLLILSYTATFEIKNVDLIVLDNDRTQTSRDLVNKFSGSPFYNFSGYAEDFESAQQLIKKGKADQLIVIESNFERRLLVEKSGKIQLITDAINGSAASMMVAYAQSIISDFNKNLIISQNPTQQLGMPINIDTLFWYNPELNYITYMVPGILVLLVTVIGMFLGSMNLVKEKEIGTIEQINVTPIKKYQFIAGKLIPFWIIANIDLAIGLILAFLVFNIPVLGSVSLLFLVASVYLIGILSIGLVISTLTNTMQQAMFISWFFLVIFILMSGLFTPIESMPSWAQIINHANPVSYFIKINRMIMLKGSGFSDILEDLIILTIFAISLFSYSILRYRKTD